LPKLSSHIVIIRIAGLVFWNTVYSANTQYFLRQTSGYYYGGYAG